VCATAMSPTACMGLNKAATDSRCMKQTRRFERFIDRLDDNKKDCYECSAACRPAELRRRATNTDHRSDSGTAIGRVCVCVCVCVRTITFELNGPTKTHLSTIMACLHDAAGCTADCVA